MSEENNEQPIPKVVGRTWVDLVFSSSYVLIGILLVGVIVFILYKIYGFVPNWIWYSLLCSLLFIPFLMERAKGDSQLVIINDGTQKFSEYRIGSRYPIYLEDVGYDVYSHSGKQRMIYTYMERTDEGVTLGGENLTAKSSLEFMRDMNILRRITNEFSQYLKMDRLTNELIALEVERKVSEYSETWLRMLYGVLDPSEINELLNQALNDEKTVKEYEIGGEMFDLSESENS